MLAPWSIPKPPARDLVVGPALHGQRPLPDLGRHIERVEHVGQPVGPAEALMAATATTTAETMPSSPTATRRAMLPRSL